MVLDNSSNLTASEFIAFVLIFSQVLPPAKALTTAFNTVQRGLASADRVFEYIDKQEIREEENGLESIKKLSKYIEFKKVGFAYEKENVLENISFKINKGEKVAIVGPSGGGKSTIIDLLSKFYKIKRGSIIIDGKEINCAGEGNGPVNALDNAIRSNFKKVEKYYQYFSDLKLLDYKVRILNTGTGATTRVSIESTDKTGKSWFTIGVSQNIIEASFKALIDSLEYKLFKEKAPANIHEK